MSGTRQRSDELLAAQTRGLAMHHPGLTVGDVMHGKYPVADPGEGLASVLGRLPSDGSAVVVLQDHHLVGVLDPEHIGKLLEVRGVVAGHAA